MEDKKISDEDLQKIIKEWDNIDENFKNTNFYTQGIKKVSSKRINIGLIIFTILMVSLVSFIKSY